MTPEAKENIRTSLVKQVNTVVDKLLETYEKLYDLLPAELNDKQKEAMVNSMSHDVFNAMTDNVGSMCDMFDQKTSDPAYIANLVAKVKGDMNE